MFRFLIEKGEGREIQKKHFEEGIRDPWFLFAEKNLFTWGSGRGGGGLAPVEFGLWDEQACHSDSADAAHGDDDVGDCNVDRNKDHILEITTMSRNSDWRFVKTISQTFVCSLVMFRQSWQSEDIHLEETPTTRISSPGFKTTPLSSLSVVIRTFHEYELDLMIHT